VTRIAIVSDVHGSLRALDAVINDLRQQSPDVVYGGIPVVMQHRFMRRLRIAQKTDIYRLVAADGPVLAFELGEVFSVNGEIWDDETFERVLEIPGVVGVKHSSLDRNTELRRLAARDAFRPDFRVYTGNDLAIDMVLYGSDYLLGLSTFAPSAFAARDRALAVNEVGFLRLNDDLQHLGNVGFRAPVPAYKHSAAQFLHLTGGLDSDEVHPRAPRRPGADRALLFDCALRLGMIADPEAAKTRLVTPYLAET
jgi:4-hydroxy-tetrahydrodipicolinate synthase